MGASGDQHNDASKGRSTGPGSSRRVLVLSRNRSLTKQIVRLLESGGHTVEWAASLRRAQRLAQTGRFAVALIDHRTSQAAAIDGVRAAIRITSDRHYESVLDAMRQGLDDVVAVQDIVTLPDRVRAAIAAADAKDVSAARTRRLRNLTRGLSRSRRRLRAQVARLTRDLANADNDYRARIAHVALTTEFASLIRQELDLESLLRTVLEFILARSGSTNGAVFLPATSGDLTLGAYVNCDWPRETVDTLMDQLACVAARVEDEPATILVTHDHLDTFLDGACPWLEHSHLTLTACRHDGECLAVITLFREQSSPYSPALLSTLDSIAPLIARQLARVIHVHHRHLPREQWGILGESPDDEDLGFAQ